MERGADGEGAHGGAYGRGLIEVPGDSKIDKCEFFENIAKTHLTDSCLENPKIHCFRFDNVGAHGILGFTLSNF